MSDQPSADYLSGRASADELAEQMVSKGNRAYLLTAIRSATRKQRHFKKESADGQYLMGRVARLLEALAVIDRAETMTPQRDRNHTRTD